MSYRFRLRFHLPGDANIEIAETLVELDAILPMGGPYVLKSVGDKPIRESHALILNSRAFPTEEQALTASRAAKAAVLYTAAKLRMSVDLGGDRPMGGFGQIMREQVREQLKAELRSDVHGVTIYDDTVETVFASVSASATVGKSGPTFLTVLSDALQHDLRPSDKELLALELYGVLQFESSPRARFLTLVSIVESLTDNTNRPPRALAHVENLIVQTESAELEPGERDSILGTLRWLRFRSIGQKTRDLLVTHLGQTTFAHKQADKFFGDCYEVRSQIAHYGKTPEGIQQLLPELERLASELLLQIVQ